MKRRRKLSGRGNQDGVAVLMVGILMVVLIGFASIAIDIGYLLRVRNELANAADASAHRAAQELDGTALGTTNALAAAQAWAKLHVGDKGFVQVEPEDVRFGRWYFAGAQSPPCGTAPCFQELCAGSGCTDELARAINGVRVIAKPSDTNGDQSTGVTTYFSTMLGHSGIADVQAGAIAVGVGPSQAECAFPMVVPDCAMQDTANDGSCDYCMIFSNNNDDNAGWTGFCENGCLGNPTIDEKVRDSCFDASGNVSVDPTTGECTGLCSNGSRVDDVIQIKNGNMLNKNNFCKTIQDILLRNGAPAKKFTVTVPVIESGQTAATCSGAQFSGQKAIVGYATMEIWGASCGQGAQHVAVLDPEATQTHPECLPSPNGDSITATLRCDLVSDGPGGGVIGAAEAKRIRIVQ